MRPRTAQDASPGGRRCPSRARRAGGAALIAAGLTLVAMTACESPSGSPPAPTGGPLTVQGRVVDLMGNPIPHADVLVAGSLAATSADGRFTVTGVSAPYDLAVYVEPANAGVPRPTAVVYRGLTLSSATFQIGSSLGTPRGASVKGSIDRQLSSVDEEVGALLPGGTRPAEGVGLLSSDNTPAFDWMPFSWGGGASRDTTFFALTLTASSNVPDAYTGYAAVPWTLDDGVDRADLSAVPSPSKLDSVSLSGTVAPPPAGYTLTSPTLNVGRTLLVRFTSGAAGAAMALGADVTSANVPRDEGGTIGYALAARAEPSSAGDDDAYTVAVATATPAGPNVLTLPTPPGPIAPSDGTADVSSGTAFSWEPLADSIYLVHVSPATVPSNAPEILILTAGTTATLPDLSALGFQLASGAPYHYAVMTAGPLPSVDAAVSAPGLWFEGQVALGEMFPYLADQASHPGPYTVSVPVPDRWFTSSPPVTITMR